MAIKLGINQGWFTTTDSWKNCVALNAHRIRLEFEIGTAVADMRAIVSNYASHGIKILPLASFYQRTPSTAEAQNLANWATEFGTGGNFWAGRSDGNLYAWTHIEFGNETSYTYQLGPGIGGTLAQRFRDAYNAIQATGRPVGLLMQADQNQTYLDSVFSAVPNIATLAAGWAIHPYGPQSRCDDQILTPWKTRLAAKTSVVKPWWVTEWGISTDNGRSMEDNYAWPVSMTYAQAWTGFNDTLNRLTTKYPEIVEFYYYQGNDQQPPGTGILKRENYFGLLRQDTSDKPGLSNNFRGLPNLAIDASSGGGTTFPVTPAAPTEYDRFETTNLDGTKNFTFRVKVDTNTDHVGVAYTVKRPTDPVAVAGPAIVDPAPASIGSVLVATFSFGAYPVGTVLTGFFEAKNEPSGTEAGVATSEPDFNWTHTVGSLTSPVPPPTDPTPPPSAFVLNIPVEFDVIQASVPGQVTDAFVLSIPVEFDIEDAPSPPPPPDTEVIPPEMELPPEPIPAPDTSVGDELYAELGPVAYTDTNPYDNPQLLAWCRALGAMLQPLDSVVRDEDDGTPGWSIAFDVDRVPSEFLPHLAQYAGVRVPRKLDAAHIRKRVREAAGMHRGTLDSIVTNAKRFLTGDRHIIVEERYQGNAYHLYIGTYAQETPNAGAVVGAIDEVKPAGIRVIYELIGSGIPGSDVTPPPTVPVGTGSNYGRLVLVFTSYTDLLSVFSSYRDLSVATIPTT